MNHSISLRTEPTVRQTEKIIARIERELGARGVLVEREGPGRLRFRVPEPWRAPRAGLLLAISRGQVRVSAGAGEPRKIRYEIGFARLTTLALLLTVGVLLLALDEPRLSLLNWMALVWALAFGLPWALALLRFHRLMAYAARDVLERRRAPRAGTAPGAVTGPVTGAGTGAVPGAASASPPEPRGAGDEPPAGGTTAG